MSHSETRVSKSWGKVLQEVKGTKTGAIVGWLLAATIRVVPATGSEESCSVLAQAPSCSFLTTAAILIFLSSTIIPSSSPWSLLRAFEVLFGSSPWDLAIDKEPLGSVFVRRCVRFSKTRECFSLIFAQLPRSTDEHLSSSSDAGLGCFVLAWSMLELMLERRLNGDTTSIDRSPGFDIWDSL